MGQFWSGGNYVAMAPDNGLVPKISGSGTGEGEAFRKIRQTPKQFFKDKLKKILSNLIGHSR